MKKNGKIKTIYTTYFQYQNRTIESIFGDRILLSATTELFERLLNRNYYCYYPKLNRFNNQAATTLNSLYLSNVVCCKLYAVPISDCALLSNRESSKYTKNTIIMALILFCHPTYPVANF